ncbi:Respiratory supercomplex factor 1, mitochondrial [Basidiobolus ranarum]|uniref:Respiratory supercomplex factor 1, mitochondrial n=1 Tax=Basidiobolus ranarum TaxID=34480 RepID=A0ABR2WKF3_9FUNG
MSSDRGKEDIFSLPEYESPWARVVRKSKEEPLVTIGCLGTVGALISATFNLRRGNRVMGQRMLRYRVIFQGFTLLAAIGGSVYYAQQRKNEKKLAQKELDTPQA